MEKAKCIKISNIKISPDKDTAFFRRNYKKRIKTWKRCTD